MIKKRQFILIIYSILLCINAFCQDVDTMDHGTIRVIKPKTCYATIAGKSGGIISVQELLKVRRIEIPCCSLCNLRSFIMSVRINNELLEYKAYGQFSEEMLSVIKSLPRGKKIHFEEIQFFGPDGSVRDISPMEFSITY